VGCFLRQEGDNRRAQHNDPDGDPKAEDHRVFHPAGGETGETHPELLTGRSGLLLSFGFDMAGWDALWEVAADQHGYVTVEQAKEAGVTYDALKQAAWRGHLERPVRGIYRLPTVPATGHDLEALAVLWTRDPAAALSHDSALAAYELGDINPSKYHVTVSLGRRIRKAGGEGYVIHHQHLRPEQVTWWEGIRTVTPLTAIEQALTSGVPTYLLRQAITSAYKKAMIRDAGRRRFSAHLTRKVS